MAASIVICTGNALLGDIEKDYLLTLSVQGSTVKARASAVSAPTRLV